MPSVPPTRSWATMLDRENQRDGADTSQRKNQRCRSDGERCTMITIVPWAGVVREFLRSSPDVVSLDVGPCNH